MIASTNNCGCKASKTGGPASCGEPSCPKYTLLHCQSTAPPPSCIKSPCCRPVLGCCYQLPVCDGTSVIPPCPNFDDINNCSCCPELADVAPKTDDNCICSGQPANESCCEPSEQKSKVKSEIACKGLPYNEIEAVINDNRMVIRVLKEAIEDEFDPPCDCADGPGVKVAKSSSTNVAATKHCGGDEVIYELSNGANLRPGQNSMVNKTCDQRSNGASRTITLYPQPAVEQKKEVDPNEDNDKEKKEKKEKVKTIRPIELEENPNIFLLKIRKKSSDGKHKFDLEFKTPRPWLPCGEVVKNAMRLKTMSRETEESSPKAIEGKKKRTAASKRRRRRKK